MPSVGELPIIDATLLHSQNGADQTKVASIIDEASRGYGFFFVANHGVDLCRLDADASRFIRSTSPTEKYALAINAYNPANPRDRSGFYLAIPGKKANESFCILNPRFDAQHPAIVAGWPSHESNVWPRQAGFAPYRQVFEDYFWAAFRISKLLLGGYERALKWPPGSLSQHLTEQDTLSAVSLIRYPHLADYPPRRLGEDGTELSLGDHQDTSLITILYQTAVPNLQVLFDGKYYDLPTSDDMLLVNAGTYMPYVTGGKYHAPVHRVTFINEERMSIPFFVNLAAHSLIEPESQTSSDVKTKPQTYGEYYETGFWDLIASNGQT